MNPKPFIFWAVLGALWFGILSPGVRAERLAEDRFAHLGVIEGLDGRVLDIAQDRQGFLWFGMDKGLYRYDGRQVKVYLHDPKDPHSISDNYIRRLLVDSLGDLWIATGGGRLNRWLPESEAFQRFGVDLGGLPSDLEEIAPGRFLIALELQEGIVQVLTSADSAEIVEGMEEGLCVAVDSERRSVWTFGKRQVTQHALEDLSKLQTIPWPEPFTEQDQLLLDCAVAGDGSLWSIFYSAGAARLHPEKGEATVFRHSPVDDTTLTGNDLSRVLEDAAGTLWIAGFSGLNRYLPESGTFERFASDPSNDRGLISQQIHSLFEDQTGQLWMGTDFGAARFDALRQHFLFYSHDPTGKGSAPAGSIRSFAEDEEGRLWVGSRNHGIVRMDRASGETVAYETYEVIARDGGKRLDNTAWALDYEAPGRLWVGGEGGLYRLSMDIGDWRWFFPPGGESSPRIVTLFRDRRGTLWAGGDDGGLFRHDADSDTLVRVDLGMDSRIMSMTDDAEGRLYIGLEWDGLVVLDLEREQRLEHWPQSDFVSDQQEPCGVLGLVTVPGEPETIWAATLCGGLYRLEAGGQWSRFDREQGLALDSIHALEAEPDGTLWLSTGRATLRIANGTGDVRRFQSADGFPSLVHKKASFQNRAGEFFFGGLDGFVAFLPDLIRMDESPPRVLLTDFRIDNQSMAPRSRQPESPLEKSITLAEEVTLKYFQNNISIEIAALHFGDPARNRFAYRLEGVDGDWVETSVERSFARYSRIPAGDYVFRAKAANRDGVWSEEEAQLRIRVLPAPWQSWWARALYVCAAIGLIAWWFQAKTARLRLEKELQEKELKVLRGLLPICSYCKKIRDDEGLWEPLEHYLDSHSEAQLSHGICPECKTDYFGGVS